VFRTEVAPSATVPGSVSSRAVRGLFTLDVEVIARPSEPGSTISFIVPSGIVPLQSNLAGARRGAGPWTARYVGPLPDGVAFRCSFGAGDDVRLTQLIVAFNTPRLPGGGGWQRLPAWLPQDQTVWAANATYFVPVQLAPRPAIPAGDEPLSPGGAM
jgi:hypothetical protein